MAQGIKYLTIKTVNDDVLNFRGNYKQTIKSTHPLENKNYDIVLIPFVLFFLY